jgi:adenylate cyclase
MTTPAELAQKERQLNLLMALDQARDALEGTDDPNAMFNTIMQELKATFKADVCAIMLLTEVGNTIESIIYAGTTHDIAVSQCRKAMHLSSPAEIMPSQWPHTLGMTIVRDETKAVLGGIFMARQNVAFSEEDTILLTVAESQIDSAVIQARMVWKLANRNRELEAIYQIDRARDSNPTESDLINHFTGLLTEYFKAELSLIFLSHMDTGEMLLRGVMDKGNLPPEMLAVIQGLTGTITFPQTVETPLGLGELNLLAAPLVVAGVKLGAVVVGRRPDFTNADQTLLFAMMTQMDSAIVHSRVIQQLNQRNRELETIYRIDHIRDTELDMDTMLQQVLSELCAAVFSEIGYLMLFTETEERRLELNATTVEGVLTSPAYHQAIHRYSRQALDAGGPVCSNKPEGPVRSLVAIPLILNEEVIGVFGVINSRSPYRFSAEDRRVLQAITSQVDTAVFERLERRQMRRVLSRSVDPKVIDHLLSRTHDNILAGEWVNLSVIFADLRGSTAWTQRTKPEQLVRTLNRFLGTMTEVIFKHGGTLDKFVGDEVIGLFGTPASMDDHALRAVQCAMEMQQAQDQLQAEVAAEGLELPAMGVGVSTGEVIAGEIGSPVRTDFTALGGAMNLGARLCGVAGAGQIYISSATAEATRDHIEARELDAIGLKGLGDVTAYELLEVNG